MKVLCILCLCVVFSVGQECSNKKSDDEIIIESKTSCSIDFAITEGYHIEAEIEKLQLDSSDGTTYLLLKPEHDEKDYKFVWQLNEPKNFIIFQSKVSLKFETKNTNSEFQVHLKRHGKLTTTTEPTTIITWPTPVDNDTIYHLVNISVSTVDFIKYETTFKQMLVNMTEVYCEQQKILLAEDVTIKNIHIHLAMQCPLNWPDYSTCTQVRYAIPVFLAGSSRYELTAEHLAQMWAELAALTLQGSLGWAVYDVPDDGQHFVMWLVASLVVLLVALAAVGAVRAFGVRYGGRIKRRASDTEQIIATPQRSSDASLWQASSQSVPPIFDSDPYVYFEPDAAMTSATMHQYQHPHINTAHMLNVDDSSDEEILTINSNSARTSFNQNVIQIDHDAFNRESAL